MSYATPESSVQDGRPYFLYLFDNNGTQTRLTSEPDDLTRMGEVWTASPIAHDEIEQTGNIEKSSVDLEFPLSDTFARILLDPSATVITVTIYRGHHTDLAEQHRVLWKGRVVSPKSSGQKITVPVESVHTSLRQPGCRARTQRTCRYSVYFGGCRLNREDFEVAGTVTAIDGLVLTVPEAASAPAGDYKSGILNFGGIFGWIQSQAGDQITLVSAVSGLEEEVTANGSASVFLAPGCNLSHSRCVDRFANHLNFGGFPYMSDDNPFSVSII